MPAQIFSCTRQSLALRTRDGCMRYLIIEILADCPQFNLIIIRKTLKPRDYLLVATVHTHVDGQLAERITGSLKPAIIISCRIATYSSEILTVVIGSVPKHERHTLEILSSVMVTVGRTCRSVKTKPQNVN